MKDTGVSRRRYFNRPERWVVVAALIALLPTALIALALVCFGDFSMETRCTVIVLIAAGCVWFPLYLHERLVFTLRTISSLITSLRENDYSSRLSLEHGGEALDQVSQAVNDLRDTLRRERTGAAETQALLGKIMTHINVAVLAFDDQHRLQLINERGMSLFHLSGPTLLGKSAEQLGLDACLQGEDPRIVDLGISNQSGRWELRRGSFRERGMPRTLLVLSDLTAALRKEEAAAWQRLVRVLRHEISNSLAPIQSFSQTLLWILQQDPKPEDWEEDCREGLEVISGRSEALNRMMGSFKGVADLPQPRLASVDIADWISHVAGLDNRVPVKLEAGADGTLLADRDQLDQLLLNLLKNAVEASLETSGTVCLQWRVTDDEPHEIELEVLDEGKGLAQTENLFVPFFTTKKDGSGIGLVLARRIAEAHRGSLTLTNRKNQSGCRALLKLPLAS